MTARKLRESQGSLGDGRLIPTKAKRVREIWRRLGDGDGEKVTGKSGKTLRWREVAQESIRLKGARRLCVSWRRLYEGEKRL